MAYAQISFTSGSLMRRVTFNAVVPVERPVFLGAAEKENKPLKTLYLLHGIFGHHMDWITDSRIQSLAGEKNLAVIMPSGENKFYVDIEASLDMYGVFIGEELVNFTRDLFPLSRDRNDTFIAGLSMGGYGAIRNGLKYADTFGYIAGLSSALIQEQVLSSTYEVKHSPFGNRRYYESVFGDLDKLPGSDMDVYALVKNRLAENKSIPRMYIACGTEDFLLPNNRAFGDFLTKNNVPVDYVEGPGEHNSAFWDVYIEKVLNWLPL